MNNELCKKLGIEFPLFAFTHCRDVVAEVTNAGGFGVLGAVGLTPETLEIQLNWIDEKVKGKPYGVDLLIPQRMESREEQLSDEELRARIPPEHKKFIEDLMRRHQIDPSDLWDGTYDDRDSSVMRPDGAKRMLEVAFRHPIKMFVNALGVPPAFVRSAFPRHAGRRADRFSPPCDQTC